MALTDYVTYAILILAGLIILYFILRELRIWHNEPRLAQIELDKEKLALIQSEMTTRVEPFTKLSKEKIEELRKIEDENAALELDIFAKQKTVETRIQRLENQVKDKKYDKMLDRVREEEIKLRG
jgi:hypothetical protein